MPETQLTFDIGLNHDRKPEIRIPTNRSVRPEDKHRLSRQSQKILDILKAGPVRTSQLSAVACQYGARVSEVRRYLVKQGKMVDMTEGEGGENIYEIVPLGRSAFWRRVCERGEQCK